MPDRIKLMQAFWKRLHSLRDHRVGTISADRQELLDACAEERISGMVVYANSLAHNSVLLAILGQDREGKNPWPAMLNGLSLLYWINEIDIHDFAKTGATYDVGDSQIFERCFLHSMMLQARADDIADWLAPFMLNVYRHGGWFDEDKEFGRFYTLLLEAQIERRWPAEALFSRNLSPEVACMLQALPDPNELPSALTSYCDWRIARANGYPDASVAKKKGHYVFGKSWWGVLPFELFAVQAIYRRCTGQQVSLTANHPLLQSPLMQPPPLLPLPKTEEVLLLQAFIKQVFGEEWHPLSPVAILQPTQ